MQGLRVGHLHFDGEQLTCQDFVDFFQFSTDIFQKFADLLHYNKQNIKTVSQAEIVL